MGHSLWGVVAVAADRLGLLIVGRGTTNSTCFISLVSRVNLEYSPNICVVRESDCFTGSFCPIFGSTKTQKVACLHFNDE